MKPAPVDNRTTPSQFRLTAEELDVLDRIAEFKTEEDGVKRSRADAIRMASRFYAQHLGILAKPKAKK